MPIFIWNNSYVVGAPEIDEQHQKLIQIINDLFDAMTIGKGREVLGDILTRLVDYTVYHFSTEERHMLTHIYPNYALHKAEHAALIKQVFERQQTFQSGNKMITVDLANFLSEWLQTHILDSDKKMGAFLAGKI